MCTFPPHFPQPAMVSFKYFIIKNTECPSTTKRFLELSPLQMEIIGQNKKRMQCKNPTVPLFPK